MVLAGPRRIGKSTVAEEALRRLGREGVYSARVDLFYTASLEELSTRLLMAIRQKPHRGDSPCPLGQQAA